MRQWRFHAAGALVFFLALALRVALLPTARFGGDEALFFNIGMDILEAEALAVARHADHRRRRPLAGPDLPLLDGAAALVVPRPGGTVPLRRGARRLHGGDLLARDAQAALESGARCSRACCSRSRPWAALYADRTWNPNVMPFFVTLGLLAALHVREAPPRGGWWRCLPLGAVMAHLHMSAPVAWAALAVVVSPSMRRWPRRHVLLAAVDRRRALPAAVGQRVLTGFGNTRNILAETVGAAERHAGKLPVDPALRAALPARSTSATTS